MKKFLLIALMFTGLAGRADEGMWLPLLIDRLNYVDMQKQGLRLTAEEIYSVNHSSLKDAIIQFGGGCTGEIVSKHGLLLTNHHCGYGVIQRHSTIEHDYLADGFWAKNMSEELPNPGLTARFLVRIEDVTKRVLAKLNDNMPEPERDKAIELESNTIIDEATKGTHYSGRVASFYDGNEFYLFVYETFTDVRLVGAPPSSIGKFGADTDNWTWPRHTGDFAVFRVYTGPDGKPATYSKNNIPLKPKHYLPVSTAGFEKDDFAMIMGYPGRTNRYLTSYGVQQSIDVNNPNVVKIRGKKLGIMREDMDANREVNIKYASKYAGISNYWKYYIGETRGLKRLDVVDKKLEQENAFATWVSKDPARIAKYGTALSDISAAYKISDEYALQRIYYSEAIRGAEIFTLAGSAGRYVEALKSKNTERINQFKNNMTQVDQFFTNYNKPTDIKLLAAGLDMYYNNVPVEQQPAEFRKLVEQNKNDFAKIAQNIFDKSAFDDKDSYLKLINQENAKAIEDDPAYSLMKVFTDNFTAHQAKAAVGNDQLARGNRLFMQGLREMQKDRVFYPNANSTMRLTYGKILDYYPADAVHYDYVTTAEGILEKEDPSNWEFVVPARLKELILNRDFGPYAMKNGKLPVGFLANTDITGGNSGSPVMNAKGELIGIAFDGNWEAMSGNIAFEPDLQRTISVDIRYVLFIIDKYAGATWLIDEMDIVRK